MMLMKMIILQFIADVKKDEKETGDAYGQANDVQQGIIEVLQNVPDGDGKYMTEHRIQ
jgi:hypothetical protein